MIALLQRVSSASVSVDDDIIGQIDAGLLVLLGVQKHDDQTSVRRLLDRIIGYRVFNDAQGRMNLSLSDTAGGLLLVPQFTLAADTRKGARPGFSSAAPPEQGQHWFNHVVDYARSAHPTVATGRFGTDMQVALVNDGPVTFWLEV